MVFNYILLEELSKLAWCAVIKKEEAIDIYHGSGIEIQDQGFVEGAWDGDFEDFQFHQADYLLGSGGRITAEGQVIFATPSHTAERLYSIQEDNSDLIYLSNSLPLLLFLSGQQLLPNYSQYEHDFSTILRGLPHFKRQIPLDKGINLRLYYYTNLKLEDNRLVEIPKPPMEPFGNFDNYYQRLTKALQATIDNAQSDLRHYSYGLITTISAGYDAATAAALIKDMGCDIAVTFNSPEAYALDSGEEVAKHLNYAQIITKDANNYLTNEDLLEAEFVSSGELGTGIIFTAFEDNFAGKLVAVGDLGDYMWGKNERSNNDFIFERNLFAGTSLIEHRLRKGYIVLAVPSYGMSQWNSVRAITLSDEMKAYEVGGDYCRPIARKIIEGAGVPRQAFGFKKKGAGFNYHFDNLDRLKSRMAPQSFQSFESYYKRNRRPFYTDISRWAEYLWAARNSYTSYALNRLKIPVKKRFKDSLVSNPGPPSYLFPWGIEMMVDRLKERIN